MAKRGRGGFPGGGGMPNNMNNLMKQAQKMQSQMAQMQEDLDKETFEATSGGGLVTAVVTGKKEVQKVVIDKTKAAALDLEDEDDVEMLEDTVVAAVNEAIRKADEKVNSQMSKMTGGMNMPGGLF